LEYSLGEWLHLDDQSLASLVTPKLSTAVIYLNGTRRWFLSQDQDWSNYTRLTGAAQRELSQLCYQHGLKTLIQPLLGYDLLGRGPHYLKLAVEQGLALLADEAYNNWYHQAEIRVSFYGNWPVTLSELGFAKVAGLLAGIAQETRHYTQHSLLFGVFADRPWDHLLTLAKKVQRGEELLHRYYGQPVDPVDLIIGSGQPAIWDLPLLDLNKASLYFIQAPTFCLKQETLRRILYDHLYQRLNDDELYSDLTPQEWATPEVLGLGQRTRKGWIAT
jgi:hypothetical protein